jgi:hypothetical protein
LDTKEFLKVKLRAVDRAMEWKANSHIDPELIERSRQFPGYISQPPHFC